MLRGVSELLVLGVAPSLAQHHYTGDGIGDLLVLNGQR